MERLIKAEFFKLSRVFNYRVLLVFSFAIGIAFGVVLFRLDITAQAVRWISIMGTGVMYNAALISIFAADYIAGEFSNRTFAGEIMCGASRRELFWAKVIVFFIGMLPLIFLYDFVTIAILTVKNGFGMAWNADTIIFIIHKMLFSILCNFTMGGGILLVAYLVKGKVETIGLGIGGVYILHQWCINERNPLFLKLWQVTFVYQLDAASSGRRAEPVPFWLVVLSSIIGTVALLTAASFVFRKSDLK